MPSLARRTLAFGIAAAAASPWLARAQGASASGQVLVGQVISLRGGADEYGTSVLAGVQAFLQAANKAGGVHGRAVALKTLDDEGQPARSDALARRLLAEDAPFLLFGSLEGGPSTAIMKVAVEEGVPFFGPMAGSPGLRRPHQPLVFPVRAEHLEEFRALLGYAAKTGASRPAFMRADSDTGVQHLANVQRLCAELRMEPALDLPFRPDVTDAQLDAMVKRMDGARTQVVINHGSAGIYERLVRRAHAAGLKPAFSAVNSGSTQLVRHLGEAARGMVFSQVVPSPWERKNSITREYQDVFGREKPGQDFSYGSLEGFMTAKALVLALRAAGPRLTREGFVRALETGPGLVLGDGLVAHYRPGDHAGLTQVDLAIVTRDLRFRH